MYMACMNDLYVFTSYSDNYLPVFDRFKASYDRAGLDPARLHVHTYDLSMYKQFGFQTDSWYKALREKMLFFAGAIRWMPDGAVGAFLDADIQLFPNRGVFDRQLQRLGVEDLDMLCLREGDSEEVNGGCLFVRKTAGAIKVIDHGLQMNLTTDLAYGEQTAFNNLLREDKSIRWAFLDTGCVVWGNKIPTRMDDVILHHAVVSRGIKDKVKQMQRVQNAFYGHRPRDLQSYRGSEVSGCSGLRSAPVASRGFQVVVCRHSEGERELGWTAPYDTVVYDRGGGGLQGTDTRRIVPSQNVGRESHVYLEHIVNRYDSLPDVTMFAQADVAAGYCMPIHHYRNCRLFRAVVVDVGDGFPLCTRGHGEPGFRWVHFPAPWHEAWSDGRMLHAPTNMGDFFDEFVERERPPPGEAVQCLNGAFSVTRDVIRRRPKRYYERLLKAIPDHADPEVGHYFERAWPYIFCPATELCGRHPVMIRGHRWHGVTDDDILVRIGL